MKKKSKKFKKKPKNEPPERWELNIFKNRGGGDLVNPLGREKGFQNYLQFHPQTRKKGKN